jgi:hypothetical protein
MKPHFGQKKEVEVDYGKNTKTVTVEGITVRDFQTVYANSFHKAIGYEESRRILKTLASVGLITEEPDPIDRRKTRYTLLEGGVPSNAIPPSGKEYSSSPPTQEEYSAQSGYPPTEKEYISLDDLVSVYWKEEALTRKECGVCGYVKPTVWEAETTKGQTIAICEDCVREYYRRRENVDDA